MRQHAVIICKTWLGIGSNESKVVFDRHNQLQASIRSKLEEKTFLREIFEATFDSIEMSLEQHFIDFTAQLQKNVQPTQSQAPVSARGFDKLRKILT